MQLEAMFHLSERLWELGDLVGRGLYPNTMESELKAASDAVATARTTLLEIAAASGAVARAATNQAEPSTRD